MEISKALDAAGGVVLGLWISLISFEAYLAIAAGSVTHEHLLFEKPLTLPIISVSVPLVAFFWLAPILFLLFHFYLLLQIVMLAEIAKRYNEVINTAVSDAQVRQNLRLQLPKNIFVQILAAPRAIREGPVGAMLRVVVWTTAILAPIMLLLLVQLQFLPYHSEPVTWLQRMAVLADLALVWFLWWPVSMLGEIRFPPLVMGRLGLIACAAVICFAVLLAVFPGEYAHRFNPLVRWTPIYDFIFNGNVNDVSRRRNSLFSSTLVLPDIKFVKDEDVAKIDAAELASEVFPGTGPWVLSLRGRDLNGAVFSGADLRRTDFTGARLNGANFDNARLSGSTFVCGYTGSDRPLEGCGLERASFNSAQLDGVYFLSAHLKFASFYGANAQGAIFNFAELEGANLSAGHFEGASFSAAKMSGAQLFTGSFQGATFNGTELQGVSAERADFSAATMDAAQLQGAELSGSNFRAASLYRAVLHGANLADATLEGTDLVQAMLWRARIERLAKGTDGNPFRGARIVQLRNDDVWLQPLGTCYERMDDQVAEALKKKAVSYIKADDYARRIQTEGRFDRLKRGGAEPPDYASNISGIGQIEFDDIRRQTIVNLVCARPESATLASRSIARRLSDDWGIGRGKMIGKKTADLLLSIIACPVRANFERATELRLQRIADAKPASENESGDPVFSWILTPCPRTKPVADEAMPAGAPARPRGDTATSEPV